MRVPLPERFAIHSLIKLAAVILSHANEAATRGGQVLVGTRTAAFMQATRVRVHVPLSGRTLEFDRRGRCVAGC